MLLQALTARGLRHAEELVLEELGAVVALPTGATGVAVLDALTLWAAGLDDQVCRDLLPSLGFVIDGSDSHGAAVMSDKGLPSQVSLDSVGAVERLVADGEPMRVTVEAELILDPPMFGRLREHAARSPMLVAALGQHPSVRVKVGWLFSRDRRVASVTVHAVQIGETSFPMHEAEGWLIELLRTVARRVARLERTRSEAMMGAWLAQYQLSGKVELRGYFRACADTLSKPPFGLTGLTLISEEGHFYPAFSEEICRARELGVGALDALELVGSMMLERPDVFLADGSWLGFPGQVAIREWLSQLLDSDGAPVEQVFWMGAPA